MWLALESRVDCTLFANLSALSIQLLVQILHELLDLHCESTRLVSGSPNRRFLSYTLNHLLGRLQHANQCLVALLGLILQFLLRFFQQLEPDAAVRHHVSPAVKAHIFVTLARRDQFVRELFHASSDFFEVIVDSEILEVTFDHVAEHLTVHGTVYSV